MNLLWYYSISSDLTKDEIIEIDRQIAKNRETVFFFVRNLASNAKDKTRKVIVVIILGGALYFSNVQPSEAIGLSLPPTPVVKVQPKYKHRYEMKVAPTVNPHLDKILILSTNRMIPLIYINGHYCYINDHLLKKIKGG